MDIPVLISALTLFCSSTLVLSVIIVYLRQKPITHQTPFDQICSDLCYICMIKVTCTFLTFVTPALIGPLLPDIADGIAKAVYFVLVMATTAVLMTLAYRYTLIFHGSILEDKDDRLVVWVIRLIWLTLVCASYTLDFFFGRKGGLCYTTLAGLEDYRWVSVFNF